MNFRSISIICTLTAGLAGCYTSVPDPKISDQDAKYLAMVPNFEIDMNFRRYQLDDPTGEAPGTVVVDTKQHFLYLVLPGKKAIRYGVATGSEAQGWSGTAIMQRKAEWPRWMPGRPPAS